MSEQRSPFDFKNREQLDACVAEARAVSESLRQERLRQEAEDMLLRKHETTIQLILGCVTPNVREAAEIALRKMLEDVRDDARKL